VLRTAVINIQKAEEGPGTVKNTIKDIAGSMHKAVPEASFAVRFWDDELHTIGDDPAFTLWFKTKAAVSETIADGFLGFGENYMTGDIEVEGDMQLLFRLGFAVGYTEHSLTLKSKIRVFGAYVMKQNTPRQARKNIEMHYDVGNDLFERLLGPSMVYTCAYYETPDRTLEEAQAAKLELVCRKLRLKEGERFVDLGCGWGALLVYAAKHYGISGRGYTVSTDGAQYCNDWIAREGLQDQIRVECKDYREAEGVYDKVASLGLIEHVGIRYVPGAFKKIKSLLTPGGIGLVHTIGNDVLHPPDPWFDRYLWPGGQCVPLPMLIEGVSSNGMNVVDVENLRLHYELTIFHWLENILAHEDWVRKTYGDVFMRMYRIYLEVCAASFRYGDNRLFQILFTNGLNNALPLTRDDLYAPFPRALEPAK